MNLLASRDHSRHELTTKLSRRCADDALLAQVIDQLQAENLQSDARFAETFVRSRSQRGYGPHRLKQELRQRGISSELALQALEDGEVDWNKLARDVQAKKFGEQPPVDAREKARRARFMYQRGFDVSGLDW